MFKMNRSGKGHQVLDRFAGNTDGAYPNGLTELKGVLYGTTEGGGAHNSGTIFRLLRRARRRPFIRSKRFPTAIFPRRTDLQQGEFV